MVKNSPANVGDMVLSLGQKIHWRRKWQPTPVWKNLRIEKPVVSSTWHHKKTGT